MSTALCRPPDRSWPKASWLKVIWPTASRPAKTPRHSSGFSPDCAVVPRTTVWPGRSGSVPSRRVVHSAVSAPSTVSMPATVSCPTTWRTASEQRGLFGLAACHRVPGRARPVVRHLYWVPHLRGDRVCAVSEESTEPSAWSASSPPQPEPDWERHCPETSSLGPLKRFLELSRPPPRRPTRPPKHRHGRYTSYAPLPIPSLTTNAVKCRVLTPGAPQKGAVFLSSGDRLTPEVS